MSSSWQSPVHLPSRESPVRAMHAPGNAIVAAIDSTICSSLGQPITALAQFPRHVLCSSATSPLLFVYRGKTGTCEGIVPTRHARGLQFVCTDGDAVVSTGRCGSNGYPYISLFQARSPLQQAHRQPERYALGMDAAGASCNGAIGCPACSSTRRTSVVGGEVVMSDGLPVVDENVCMLQLAKLETVGSKHTTVTCMRVYAPGTVFVGLSDGACLALTSQTGSLTSIGISSEGSLTHASFPPMHPPTDVLRRSGGLALTVDTRSNMHLWEESLNESESLVGLRHSAHVSVVLAQCAVPSSLPRTSPMLSVLQGRATESARLSERARYPTTLVSVNESLALLCFTGTSSALLVDTAAMLMLPVSTGDDAITCSTSLSVPNYVALGTSRGDVCIYHMTHLQQGFPFPANVLAGANTCSTCSTDGGGSIDSGDCSNLKGVGVQRQGEVRVGDLLDIPLIPVCRLHGDVCSVSSISARLIIDPVVPLSDAYNHVRLVTGSEASILFLWRLTIPSESVPLVPTSLDVSAVPSAVSQLATVLDLDTSYCKNGDWPDQFTKAAGELAPHLVSGGGDDPGQVDAVAGVVDPCVSNATSCDPTGSDAPTGSCCNPVSAEAYPPLHAPSQIQSTAMQRHEYPSDLSVNTRGSTGGGVPLTPIATANWYAPPGACKSPAQAPVAGATATTPGTTHTPTGASRVGFSTSGYSHAGCLTHEGPASTLLHAHESVVQPEYLNGVLVAEWDDVEFEPDSPPLGSGQHGTVRRATWKGLQVAVKEVNVAVMPGCDTTLAHHMRRFQAEFNVHARIVHSFIVQLFAVARSRPIREGEVPRFGLILELGEVGSLATYLQTAEGKEVSTPDRLHWLQQVTAAIVRFHLALIQHGDIKASNVVLTRGEGAGGSSGRALPPTTLPTAKLCDFGCSGTSLDEVTDFRDRSPGAVLWLAPELLQVALHRTSRQAAVGETSCTRSGVSALAVPATSVATIEGQHLARAVDMYALGITMWEVLTGCVPYTNLRFPSWEALAAHVCSGGRPDPALLPCDTPKCIRDVMCRCWDADPSKRPLIGDVYHVMVEAKQAAATHARNNEVTCATAAAGTSSTTKTGTGGGPQV